MTTYSKRHPTPTLHIVRVPGELGPVVRCSGELTLATGELLRRELSFLASPRQAALILNVTGCRTLDGDGLLLLRDLYRQLRHSGPPFAVVTGTEGASRCVCTPGGGLLPVFSTEQDAARALLSLRVPAVED